MAAHLAVLRPAANGPHRPKQIHKRDNDCVVCVPLGAGSVHRARHCKVATVLRKTAPSPAYSPARLPSSMVFSSRRMTFPEAVIGTALTNCTARGSL